MDVFSLQSLYNLYTKKKCFNTIFIFEMLLYTIYKIFDGGTNSMLDIIFVASLIIEFISIRLFVGWCENQIER
jgi:hypothetical protein